MSVQPRTPSFTFDDVPGLATLGGQQALQVAYDALVHHHRVGLRNPGTGHAPCAVADAHDTPVCGCCSMCTPLAVAMLHARKGRKAYKQIPWPEFYARVAAGARLSSEEHRAAFGADTQSTAQWVHDGLERLAPWLELPADARARVEDSVALRRVIEAAVDPARVSLLLCVLGEIAVHGVRKELDGDTEYAVSVDKVAIALTTQHGKHAARVTAPLTGRDVRQAVLDAVAAVADAPADLAKQADSAGRVLDARILRYVMGDDSYDRVEASSFGGVDTVSAFAWQVVDVPAAPGPGELERAVHRSVVTKLRADRFAENADGTNIAQRAAAIEKHVRRALVAHLEQWTRSHDVPAGRAEDLATTLDRLAGALVPTIADEVRMTLADDAVAAAQPLSGEQAQDVRDRVLREWFVLPKTRPGAQA